MNDEFNAMLPPLDDAKAEEMIGKVVLVGVTRYGGDGQVQGLEQYAGTVLRISADEGVVLADEDDGHERYLPPMLDQYQRVTHISQSQLEFLTGVTEFYRARTDTKMTIAAERLAVIAAVTLPVTALSSVLGMNVIVNDQTRWPALAVLLLAMLTLSLTLLRWAKRQGWW